MCWRSLILHRRDWQVLIRICFTQFCCKRDTGAIARMWSTKGRLERGWHNIQCTGWVMQWLVLLLGWHLEGTVVS
jgi:hypothetical protein